MVAIPTISTDPARAPDVRRGAEWVASRLRTSGPVEVELIETPPRHPAVLGRWDGRPDAPTAFVCGHLDVQPADPIEAWDSPPFELTERGGLLSGRGVSDDKTSMLIPILVAEGFFHYGTPPVDLRSLFESEEEIVETVSFSFSTADEDNHCAHRVLPPLTLSWRIGRMGEAVEASRPTPEETA